MIALGVGNDGAVRPLAPPRSATPNGRRIRASPRNRDRVVNRDAIDGMINAALAADTADAWLDKLKSAGIPCGRINTVAQALRRRAAHQRGR